MVAGAVRMTKRTANPVSITARTLAADTGKTVALQRNLHTRRIVKGRTVFWAGWSPIVAEGVAQMMTWTTNPTSVTAKILAADTGKSVVSSKKSLVRIHEVRTVSAHVFKEVFDRHGFMPR